ncbi:hypothetical protein ACFSOZ_14440 [Mesorhizobium newzealandense]|uniref:Uncharacterized protein n=1 Tax=Mesorhizobium newzealandense TaxID=1300302 RepID=A0ABW4UA70_9HYPH
MLSPATAPVIQASCHHHRDQESRVAASPSTEFATTSVTKSLKMGGLVAAVERVQRDVTEIRRDINDSDARAALSYEQSEQRASITRHRLLARHLARFAGWLTCLPHRQAYFVLAGKLFPKSEVCATSCRFGSLKRRIFP